MKKTLWWGGILAAAAFALAVARTDASASMAACPEVYPDECLVINLEEVCGPGCTVSIIGRN